MLYLFVYIDTYFVLTYFLYHVVKNVLDWFQVVFWFNKKTTQSACVRLEPLFGPHLALRAAATLPTPPLGEQEQDQHKMLSTEVLYICEFAAGLLQQPTCNWSMVIFGDKCCRPEMSQTKAHRWTGWLLLLFSVVSPYTDTDTMNMRDTVKHFSATRHFSYDNFPGNLQEKMHCLCWNRCSLNVFIHSATTSVHGL